MATMMTTATAAVVPVHAAPKARCGDPMATMSTAASVPSMSTAFPLMTAAASGPRSAHRCAVQVDPFDLGAFGDEVVSAFVGQLPRSPVRPYG